MQKNLNDRFLKALDGKSHKLVANRLRNHDLKLPKSFIKGSGQAIVWDGRDGFGVMVSTASGAATLSFVVRYVVAGDRRGRRQDTLGRYPGMTLSTARRQAQALRELAASGVDPRLEKRREQQQQQRERDLRFETVTIEFVDQYARPKNRSWRESARLLGVVPDMADASVAKKDWPLIVGERGVAAEWRGLPIGEITRLDVAAMLRRVQTRSGSTTANRTLAAVRRLFRWAVTTGLIDSSPVIPGMAVAPEVQRDRVLTVDEMRRIWDAAAEMAYPWGPYLQVLMLTCLRRGEVANLRWDAVDFDDRVITLSPAETKNRRQFRAPMTDLMVDILKPVHGESSTISPWIFTTNGNVPIRPGTVLKRKIDELSGVSGWRIHDLRRSGATRLAECGFGHHLIKASLNHVDRSDVTLVYQRYDLIAERREALTALGDIYIGRREPPAEGEVIELRAQGGGRHGQR
jgi:integrase